MRLSTEKRQAIVDNVKRKLFDGREKQLRQDSNTIALTIYRRLYSDDVIEHMSHLPDEFFSSQCQMYAKFDGENIQFNLTSSKKVSSKDCHGYKAPCYNVPTDDTLYNLIVKFNNDKKKVTDDRKEVSDKLWAMLNQITTVKRLQAEWPDGLPYYENLIDRKKVDLPVVQSDDVISLINRLK